MRRVTITGEKHPHRGETGAIVKEGIFLMGGALGPLERIRTDDGSEFLAEAKDYHDA